MRGLVSTSGPVSARRLVLSSGLVVMIMVFLLSVLYLMYCDRVIRSLSDQ